MHLKHLFASLTLFAVTTAAPWFCRKYACPSFTSEDHGGYEIRNYTETKWVATSIMSRTPDPTGRDSRVMFMDLYHYIGGDNVQRERIRMTVPVLTKTEKMGYRYKITMMFYLTDPNPPAPTERGVYLITRPAGNVFVRSFPTWRWPSNYWFRVELNGLKKIIANSSLYEDNASFKAGYNSPREWGRKQHEVWLDAAF